VSDRDPGIAREAKGKNFSYKLPDGKIIRNARILGRIRSLHIPPAWKNVWICINSHGHIQATGFDDRGRKQYCYHPRWNEIRDQTKFNRMIEFGKVLPNIRKATEKDLKLPGLQKEKILATIVQLLEKTLIRVGNEEYAKENNSFGLTTMRDKHVKFNKSEMSFTFRGKSGVSHVVTLDDPELTHIIRKCHDLPGYELFQYIDENGNLRKIDSSDVNGYIQKISNADFTAKDFRTWSGTVLAAQALQEFTDAENITQAKKNVVAAIESVAKQLGNTRAICRKCYVHPDIINAYLDGSLVKNLSKQLENKITHSLHSLTPEEAAVMVFLQKRLRGNIKI